MQSYLIGILYVFFVVGCILTLEAIYYISWVCNLNLSFESYRSLNTYSST